MIVLPVVHAPRIMPDWGCCAAAAKLELKQHRRDAMHLVSDYSQLITDLPPIDTVFVGFNPGGGGGGGRRAVMAAAAVSEPVSAPGQAQLEAVKGMLQSQLPFLDGQVGALHVYLSGRGRRGQHA